MWPNPQVPADLVTFTEETLQGCVRYIFASFLLGVNKTTCQIKKNVFYFTTKPPFVFDKIKFQNFTFSHFMTSSNA